MIPLNEKEMKQLKGGLVTATALLGYVAVAAGVAAIIKIITSSRGKYPSQASTFNGVIRST